MHKCGQDFEIIRKNTAMVLKKGRKITTDDFIWCQRSCWFQRNWECCLRRWQRNCYKVTLILTHGIENIYRRRSSDLWKYECEVAQKKLTCQDSSCHDSINLGWETFHNIGDEKRICCQLQLPMRNYLMIGDPIMWICGWYFTPEKQTGNERNWIMNSDARYYLLYNWRLLP
jgi:hypothetical protein